MHADVATVLREALASHVPIEPLSDKYPQFTATDAYKIQDAWLQAELARGGRLAGRKVGLTGKAIQQQLGVDSPDFGFLLQTMMVKSGDTLQRGSLIKPRIEPEIAFTLGSPLKGPGVSREDVLAATTGVSPAIEVVDSRIADWRIKLVDTIADNGSSCRAVVSDKLTAPSAVDLGSEAVRLLRNGEEVGSGVGSSVLGHPAEAVAWLANFLAEFGESLAPGQVILPGAMCAMVYAEAGDTFTAEFSTLGSVTVKFA